MVGGALATASGSIKFARVRSFPPGQNKYNLILISWIITKYRTQFGLSDGDVRGVAGGVVLAEPSWARAWFSRTTCGDLPHGRRWKGPHNHQSVSRSWRFQTCWLSFFFYISIFLGLRSVVWRLHLIHHTTFCCCCSCLLKM